MPTLFNFLFICPPCDESYIHQLYTSSKSLPLNPHFEFSKASAFEYLQQIKNYQFPSVILIDENLGKETITEFLSSYRNQFYSYHIETLLFICSNKNDEVAPKLRYHDILSGVLQKPFNKAQFMQEVIPNLTVNMV